MQVNEDTLEDVLLFVGILSGRGYRHRRLAVREAWANQCQKPGVSVCRFMLSEDEVTPQASILRLPAEASDVRAYSVAVHLPRLRLPHGRLVILVWCLHGHHPHTILR